ncbi:hypothetical protein Cni_G10018 [Canna indica]|uniref:Reverse transcriptase domain-containing protein n=1 Tax=Canna indica TaxID=4628 RepID=A0AAQ3K3N8_9LILI|nr:hypothetical protein Cni_G10018 [Canna indica]
MLMDKNSPDIILLAETHLNEDNSLVCIRKFGSNWSGIFVAGVGRSGGILLVWKTKFCKVNKIFECNQLLNAMVFPNNSKPWLLSGVYVSNKPAERTLLWSFLGKIETSNLPWLVIGDFNCVHKQDDKKGGNIFKWGQSTRAYRDFCMKVGLTEVRYHGSKFTWCNNRSGGKRILARLDKALINWEWIGSYNKNQVKHLCRIALDHKPILLSAGNDRSSRYPKRRFIFEHYWFEYQEVEEIIKNSWMNSNLQSHNMSEVSLKLSTLGKKLNDWAKQNIGQIEKEMEIAKLELTKFDLLDEASQCNDMDICKMRSLSNKIMALNSQVHIKWWSKARSRWLEENDKNTKFFHDLTRFKRSKNIIPSIVVDGKSVEEPVEIANAFANWYMKLWEEDTVNVNCHEWEWAKELKWNKIGRSKKDLLCKEFSAEEIWCAANNLGRGKAPGPDGYNVEFFIKYWGTVGGPIVQALKEFCSTARIPNSRGETSIIFIPKKEGPLKITDYRPIALCNVAYKILSKTIVNRIRPLVKKLISSEQCAFIEGRRIHDNILIVSELASIIHKSKRKKPYILLKVDSEKAFDRVSWKAVSRILGFMNFSKTVIEWVMACLESARFSCCVNGMNSNKFASCKGVRQGDPISPYIFIIMQELLSKILNEYVDNGHIKGFKYRGVKISHLSFADDLLIIVKGCVDNCIRVQNALNIYCKLSGGICKEFGIKEGKYPMKYLGTFIGPKKLDESHQEIILTKALSRVEGWAGKNISQAGKQVLLNSVVGSIPMHTLATSWINNSIVNKYQSIARNYLWSNDKKKKGFHLVGWSKVTMRKYKGGLGLKDLGIVKLFIHAKRILLFLNKEKHLWSRILRAKYGNYHPWTFNRKNISWSFKGLHEAISCMREGLRIRIGDGTKVDILNDPWLSNIPINKWPTFINMEMQNKFQKVCQLMEKGDWNHELILDFLGEQHYNNVAQIHISRKNKKDKWIWSLDEKGILSCKAAYNFMKEKNTEEHILEANWKKIWNLRVIPKVKTFVWKLDWGRLPTTYYLSKFSKITPSHCFACKDGKDCIDHILFECPTARCLWLKLEQELGFKFRFMDKCGKGDWLYENVQPNSELGRWSVKIIAAALWNLWKNRNCCYFKNKRIGLNTLLCRIRTNIKWSSGAKDSLKMVDDMGISVYKSKEGIEDIRNLHKGSFMVFCDVAWMNTDTTASMGNYITDEKGNEIAKGCNRKRTCSPLAAELWAIWFGLSNCSGQKISNLVIFSDCLQAVIILNRKDKPPWHLFSLVKDIWTLGNLLNVDRNMGAVEQQRRNEVLSCNETFDAETDATKSTIDSSLNFKSAVDNIGLFSHSKNNIARREPKFSHFNSINRPVQESSSTSKMSGAVIVNSYINTTTGCDASTSHHVNKLSCIPFELGLVECCKDLLIEMNKSTRQDDR